MMADPDSEFLEMMKMLAAQIPEMAALFAGILFSFALWRKHPRPALLAFLAFGLLLVVSAASIVIVILGPRVLGFNDPMFEIIVWAVRSLLFAVAYVLLIIAVYSGRKPPPPRPPSS